MIHLLLADDHTAIREGLRFALSDEPDIEVCEEEATNGEEAVRLTRKFAPDIVLMDVRMPVKSGVQACVEILAERPNTGVVLFTAHDDPGILTDALTAGGRGFILKNATNDDLLRAIHQVSRGGIYLDPALAHELVHTRLSAPTLSEREREVLSRVARGMTHDAIARELVITVETVRTHVRNACKKLKAENKTHAVALALHHRLISLD